jgi:hypothetical protein
LQAKSPDLAPIEVMWPNIKHNLRGRVFKNPDELFEAAAEVWRNVDQ